MTGLFKRHSKHNFASQQMSAFGRKRTFQSTFAERFRPALITGTNKDESTAQTKPATTLGDQFE
jgi:hypothetical protein